MVKYINIYVRISNNRKKNNDHNNQKVKLNKIKRKMQYYKK